MEIDAIQWNNLYKRCTLFRRPISMAATWNSDLEKEAGKITLTKLVHLESHGNFIRLRIFGRQPLWPRLWKLLAKMFT